MQGKVDAVISAAGDRPATKRWTPRSTAVSVMSTSIPSGPNAKKTLEMLTNTYFVELNPSPQTPVVKEKSHIIGYDFMLWAYKDVPDEVVMKVVKALYDHADELKASSADLDASGIPSRLRRTRDPAWSTILARSLSTRRSASGSTEERRDSACAGVRRRRRRSKGVARPVHWPGGSH